MAAISMSTPLTPQSRWASGLSCLSASPSLIPFFLPRPHSPLPPLSLPPPHFPTRELSALLCLPLPSSAAVANRSALLSSASSLPSRCLSRTVFASASAVMSSQPKTVLVPIANGTEEMEAVIIIDVLRRAGADVTVASVETELQVFASRQVKLVADKLIGECASNQFDLVALPGGMPGSERLRDSAGLKALVEQQSKEGREVAAICAAPVVALAAWGLLKGRRATAHPGFSAKLDDASAVGERVVEDGNVTTSRGPGTAFEFALALVGRLFGADKAAAVAGPMVMPGAQERWRVDEGDAAWRSAGGGDGGAEAGVPPRVLVPIADGTEEMEAVIVIDVLRRAGAQVVVASVEDSLQVVASRKVKIVADVSIQEASSEKFDVVVLPGGMPGAERLRDSPVLHALLQAQASAHLPIAAICASPVVVLHAKGLLSGVKATAHPAFSHQLADQSCVPARVVRHGLVLTSRGPGTAFEFALALVECLFGADKAAAVAQPMVVAPALLVASA